MLRYKYDGTVEQGIFVKSNKNLTANNFFSSRNFSKFLRMSRFLFPSEVKIM